MQPCDMLVQPGAACGKPAVQLIGIDRRNFPQEREALAEAFHHRTARQFCTMQVERQMAEPRGLQAFEDDLECRAFLGDEESALARCGELCDEVGDRLALASTRR